ncbi:hypothetical protein BHM03_00030853 [Ensete ventricosum]|nr:hypothetical protein BHM03_00030853 [Ensete ventricosum]
METDAQAVVAKRSSASRFRRVCVFCGSSPGKKASYQLAATQLGHELVSSSIVLYVISSCPKEHRLGVWWRKRWPHGSRLPSCS